MFASYLKFCITLIFFIGGEVALCQNCVWAKSYGMGDAENNSLVKADHEGNIFCAGAFIGQTDIDPGPNLYTINPAMGYNGGMYVSKLDANGDFLWGFSISAYYPTYIFDLEITQNNDLLIAGRFTGCVDFNPGSSAFMLCSDTSNINYRDDVFLLKVNSNGDFVSALNLGGNYGNYVSLCLDSWGNTFIASNYYYRSDFDPSLDTNMIDRPIWSGNEGAAFITKIDSSDNYLWTKTFIGQYCSIATDDSGNIYINSFYGDSADVDPGPNTFNLYNTLPWSQGGNAAYISKLNNNGDLIWAKNYQGRLGSSGYSYAFHYLKTIVVDDSGGISFCGTFRDSVDFDPGPDSAFFYSDIWSDFFVTHLDGAGNYVWTKVINTNNSLGVHPYGFDIDLMNNLYVLGEFKDTIDFDPSPNVFYLSPEWMKACTFLLKLNPSGDFISAKMFGGTANYSPVIGCGIDIDSAGTIYTVGGLSGTVNFDFPSSWLVSGPSYYSDFFVAKHSQPIVGVSEKENLEKIAVYPNPSSGFVWLSFEKTHPSISIVVYNVFGQELDKKTFSNTSKINLNINGPQGVYYLVTTIDNKEKNTLKFIKQ